MQVASSIEHKTRSPPDDVIPREEQGTRGGREETVTGTGAGTGTRMGTRTGMGKKTGAGTRTRVEMRLERRESLGTYQVVIEVIEVGRKTRERGRRQRVTSSRSRKPRRPSETVAPCRRPEPRDGGGKG